MLKQTWNFVNDAWLPHVGVLIYELASTQLAAGYSDTSLRPHKRVVPWPLVERSLFQTLPNAKATGTNRL